MNAAPCTDSAIARAKVGSPDGAIVLGAGHQGVDDRTDEEDERVGIRERARRTEAADAGPLQRVEPKTNSGIAASPA